jgi:hypothetical protein
VRATWLTDIHLEFLRPGELTEFYALVRRERPEVILLTGDVFAGVDPARWARRFGEIALTYFVLGNHDFYGATINGVRRQAAGTAGYLPAKGPVRLTEQTTLIGVDGWGDARAGDVRSTVRLNDWRMIDDLRGLGGLPAAERARRLRDLGRAEADLLRDHLAQVSRSAPGEAPGEAPGRPRQILILTHVPPFVGACWHDGRVSSPDWLPWFTCVSTGEVIEAWADDHPDVQITVLCGHTHGQGEHRPRPNVLVRTGGWAPGQRDYGNPVVQDTWQIA